MSNSSQNLNLMRWLYGATDKKMSRICDGIQSVLSGGEFQLRTEFPEKVMLDIGSIGYAVRVSEQGKGYGKAILRLGLELAKQHGMEKVLLTINEENKASIHVCEKLGGIWKDTIDAYNDAEGQHLLRRYWITL